MKYWLLLFLQLTVVRSMAVVVNERAQVWTLLSWLGGNKHEILTGLYPLVSGVDEQAVGAGKLAQECRDIVKGKYNDPDFAALFYKFAQEYPMGYLNDYGVQPGSNFVVLNGENYTEPDKIYYFKSGDLAAQAAVEDATIIDSHDVVIGDATNSDGERLPLVIFYGCPDNEDEYEQFSRTLYLEATENKKLRYVWRSTCVPQKSQDENKFPVGITVTGLQTIENVLNSGIELDLPDRVAQPKAKDLENLVVEELEKLDYKLISAISVFFSTTGHNFVETFKYAKKLCNSLPLIMPQMLKIKEFDTYINESNKSLKKNNIDHNMLGLYVNGQYLKITQTYINSLLHVLRTELDFITGIHETLKKAIPDVSLQNVKRLMDLFSMSSIPNLSFLQPVKVDTHRIQGFSESVIYFNDIEKDIQYEDFSENVEVFFKESKYGILPEFKQNWNELVFVIDFDKIEADVDAREALGGMLRAIQIVQNGYPQRIGLIPFSSSGNKRIIRKIYELKSKKNLEDVVDYLQDILELNFGRESNFKKLPDYDHVRKELSINSTSIIINGNIFPFRKNTWNYLVSHVMKKDVTYIKEELGKLNKQTADDVDIRGLLHLKSLSKRNTKFIKDYFIEAAYTRVNESFLKEISNRVIQNINDTGHNIIHTITLIDDFNTENALIRLKNIVGVKFNGLKFRVIHTGDIGSSSCWNKFYQGKNIVNEVSKIKLNNKCKSSNGVGKYRLPILTKVLPDVSFSELSNGPLLLVNGRVSLMNEEDIPTISDIESLLVHESKRTIDLLYNLEEVFPGFSEKTIEPEFIESLSSFMTKMFYHGANSIEGSLPFSTETSVPRMNLRSLFVANNITTFRQHADEKPVDITLIVDPVEERSQKFLTLANQVMDLPFVNINLILYCTQNITLVPNNRIYFENMISTTVLKSGGFEYTLDKPWYVRTDEHDKISGHVLEVHNYAADQMVTIGIVEGERDVCLMLRDSKGNIIDKTTTMRTYGFAELTIPNLGDSYVVESCDSRYRVDSYELNAKSDYTPTDRIHWRTNLPNSLFVKVSKVKEKKEINPDTETVNFFTTIANHEEEEQMKETMLKIIATTGERPVTFYIWDESSITESFRDYGRLLNKLLPGREIHVEFVKYEWPPWLRPQRFRQKRLAISKLLFLDLLFPSNVSKVLLIGPNMDTYNLTSVYDMTLKRAIAMPKAQGKGYWSEGHWAEKIQKHSLVFHSVEPFILVDLDVLRSLGGGDYLRIHYQQVSADIKSLEVIDQDLLNDIQIEMPIRTLRKSALKTVEVSTREMKKLKSKLIALENDPIDLPESKSKGEDEEQQYFDDEL